ncbi:MBL fold metallo-hydrolase [Runella slithyformis]|uniref:Rhodanese-like protein n=1 Tax=Runella slithyformis (strain ATCC 29530 / DSM 19594 / LMG 11500 / NCIMB 11436 / LSU 4) TaxID=761193 RepID=A0A7U4E9C0_RUNSL|nr:MBL fold metallo-hydrolase [Runella slithyformis]AEI52199.1 Rhodanese-like protein [Runella slithyformis DSM 19594]
MKVEQIYTGCLAEAAYYIESEGEAAIIDPLRDTKPYIDRATKEGANIKYVFETHFHADFVSGHLDLSAKTGATIVFGPTAKPAYTAYTAQDGEDFQVGKIKIRAIHTPGHTMESTCFLLMDETGKETAIFTGDTLFIGDVGRPDLAQHVISDLTEEKLAGHLYESLRNKIIPLPNELIVYPGHGAGSACGKKMSKETTDTLGNQKLFNYALNLKLTKEQFIKETLTGLVPPPSYFPQNVLMNIKGYESLDEVMQRGSQALSPEAFEAAANETEALVLDVREAQTFAKGFIPNAINIGIEGQFASWVGTLIPDLKQPILLVTEAGKEEETITRLARVGYDNCIGYLQGGIQAWKDAGKEADTVTSISAEAFSNVLAADPTIAAFDVRKKSEYDSEHVIGVENLPLDFLNDNMAQINPDKTYFLHCAGGYRSMIAVSILKARGFENLIDVAGGFAAIKAVGKLPLTEYVCPSTML